MSNIEIVQSYISASNNHDVNSIQKLFDTSGTYVDPATGTEISGQHISGYLSVLFQGFPDLHYEITSMIESSNTVIFEWLMSGTNTGNSAAHPATHKTIQLPGIDVITVDQAKIKSVKVYFDRASYAEQLGLVSEREVA
jgi:steroid delta-isomerase-like uncharacterized protein